MTEGSRDRLPAPYSTTDELEIEAINILKRLLHPKFVKADIRERDKMPNIDGYIELVDDSRYPEGKLEVQIKRMPKGNIDRPRHPLPISLIEYAKRGTNNPVLFISVDCCNSVAYWHEVSVDALSSYSERIDQNDKTVTLIFPPENRIDSESLEYIDAWKEIFQQRRLSLFQNEELRRQIEELRERSHPLLREVRPEFTQLHSFIDEVNRLIETEFPVVKRAIFENCWKLGVSYKDYSDQMVTYAIYPIPPDKNDLQIMQLPDDHRTDPIPAGVRTIQTHYTSNPLQKEPRQHAVSVVKKYIDDVLKARLLSHAGSDFLAREFLFEVIDRLAIPMGLEGRDRVRVSELHQGFYVRLPFWIDEALRHLYQDPKRYPMRLFSGQGYIKPASLIPYIHKEERLSIEQKIERRIGDREVPPSIRMGDEKTPLGIAHEFLMNLSSDPTREIARVYPRKDYDRCNNQQGSWIWDVYSEDELATAITTFFENLPSVYAFMLNKNFPEISTALSSLTGLSKIVIFFKPSKKDAFLPAPSYEYYHLIGDRVPEYPEVHVLPWNEKGDFSEVQWPPHSAPECLIQGDRYRYGDCGSSIGDFLFKETPMLNYVYELFEKNLKSYFKNRYDVI